MNMTNKKLAGVAVLLTALLSGCGVFEKAYDNSNYESMSNEKGDITLFSGGVNVGEYKNATVRYASADSEAVWITAMDGTDVYWQGHMLFVAR